MRLYRDMLVWGIVALLGILSLVSVFNILTITFIMVPFVMLYAKLPLRYFLIVMIAAAGITALVARSMWLPLMAAIVFYTIPSVLMGQLYKKQAKAGVVLASGVGCLMGELLLILLLSSLLGVNIPQEIADYTRSVYTLPMFQGLMTADQEKQNIQTMIQMIPLFMILFSLYYGGITHWIVRRLLKHSGMNVHKMKPIKDWTMPKSLVWYYLILLVLDLLIPARSGSIWGMVVVNLVPLLMFIFYIQGISFLFFLAHYKRWAKYLPILGIVLMPLLLNIISILGLFDTAFPVRERLMKP